MSSRIVSKMERDRATGLDEMVRDAEDAGIYDLPEDATVERLSTSDERDNLD